MCLILLIVLSLSSSIHSLQACPPNEGWTDCVNPCLNCVQKGRCTGLPLCQPGCDCRPGYLRDGTGLCVPKSQCIGDLPQKSSASSRCPKNSVFAWCGPGCNPTCEYPEPEDCSEECVPGCYCLPGFFKTEEGICVPPKQCDYPINIECKEDERYFEECTPRCKNTCENYNNPSVRCGCDPPGCFCAEGLVLRADGKCVQPLECYGTQELPPPTPKCPEHAVFIPCGPACPPTCENRNPPGQCKLQCIPECHCKPGYLRHKNRCVPVEECVAKTPQGNCPPDEQYYDYIPNCKNTCENFRNPGIICNPGPPGCFCKEGLVKRRDGKCVSPHQCLESPQCPENAIFLPCGSACPETCENRNPGPCKDLCIPGCFCKPGFLKLNDKCVKAEKCETTYLPSKCYPDEQYYDYIPNCKNTCENYNNPAVRCAQGLPGCFCKTGLVKRKDGKCVQPRDCLVQSQCPNVGEKYYDYIPTCKNTCENYRNSSTTCPPGPPGCFCREGLVRRADGKCVDPRDCPVPRIERCPENEVFIPCGPPCPPTCEDTRPLRCKDRCVSACYCKPGYLKNKEGKCIHVEDCFPKVANCPPDEQYYAYVPNCKNTCENFNNPGVRCQPGPPGCFCKDGLVRRKDGRCVRPQECQVSVKCQPDEQYYDYVPNCKNTCENFNNPRIRCSSGQPGCFCRQGLVKRSDGRCVNPLECPAKCGPDEQYYEYVPNCKNTCENFNNPRVSCKPGPPGCFCKYGLIRSQDGRCIRPQECPVVVKCSQPDEQYYDCIPNCKNTCENYNNSKVSCTQGPPGCFCKTGLVKRLDGKCVNPKECPAECHLDEKYYTSIPNCKNTCENYSNPGIRCIPGPPGCFCLDGLVKRRDGKCVRPQECPVFCPPEEQIYDYVPNCKNTCENFNNPEVRCSPGPPGCFCRQGLVKRQDGRCVDPKECPASCLPDEQYYDHIPGCKNTCENFNNPGVRCEPGPPGCFCRQGLVKRQDGRCVDPKECAVKCPPDQQYYQYIPNCKNTCENFDNSSVRCPQGPPGCFCKDGLVKRKDGKCVTLQECPANCPPDEQYYAYIPSCKNTCENFYNPTAICRTGPPGCFCREGLVRTSDGRCVNPTECPVSITKPPAVCQENAVFIPCGSGCPPTCDNRTPGPCLERCVSACFCKPGFLRTRDNRCVLPEQCEPRRPDPKCPEYSVYLSCGPACPITCDNKSPRQCTKQCVPGCFCLSGYLKSRDNRCVLPEKCDPPQIPTIRPITLQCPLYSTFNRCASACPATCLNPSPRPCAKPCEPRCVCDLGYLLDESGKCVPREQCQPKCRLPEEEFLECGPSCPDTCDNKDLLKPPRCNRCVRGCFCKKGLLRTTEGTCIRPEQCPRIVRNITYQKPSDGPQSCPENSRYTSCASGCPITCMDPEPVRNCTVPCAPGCACDPGLYRTIDGRCVRKDRCVPRLITKCPPNSIYVECASACPSTCKNPNPGPCTKPCIPCCVCNPGFLEDDDGNCVTPSQCKPTYPQAPVQGRKLS